ncbi:hypothetical protein ABT288_23375 [Streptomyces sp. NPDC001093]|uniref:hypothetical protein n=1 Tax=Streptomyces sp. NPDC001093 TaxID=3154376 RepID=UPI0033331062
MAVGTPVAAAHTMVRVCLLPATAVALGDGVCFLAVPIFLGGAGRLVSFSQYGFPSPAGVFLASALLDFLLAIVIVRAQSTALRSRRAPAAA